MANKWFAECLPCKWQEQHDTQDAAIAAAEDHVFENHRRVPNNVRRDECIGHVQQRDTAAIAHFIKPQPEPAATEPAEPANQGFIDEGDV